MRTIYKYILLLSCVTALLSVTSCQKDDGALNSIAECSWHYSAPGQSGTTIFLAKDKYLSLMDLSIGYLSHKWEVPTNGTYFLDGKMEWGENDFESMINYDIPHVNDRSTIHVYFTEAGTFDIRLYNTFDRQVYYPYAEWNTATGENDYFVKEAVYENGIYVFDQILTVEVFDGLLAPSAEVYYDEACTKPVKMGVISEPVYGVNGSVIKPGEYEEIEIEYGDTLYFKDTSFDRPNTWAWSCGAMGYTNEYTGYEKLGSVIPITFQQLTDAPNAGIETKPLVVRLTVERADTANLSESKDVPSASKVSADIPVEIIVKPTTKPLVCSASQVDQTTLNLQLLNSQFSKKAEFDPSNFVVKYKNDYEGAALVEGSIVPKAVTLTADLKVLQITLPDDNIVYNTDEISIEMLGVAEQKVLFDGGDFLLESATPVATTYCPIIWEEDFEDEAAATAAGWNIVTDAFLDLQDREKDGVMIDSFNIYAENLNEYDYSTQNEGHSMMVNGTLYDGKAPLYTNKCITLISPVFTNPIATKLVMKFKTYVPTIQGSISDGLSPSFNTVESNMSQNAHNEWCGQTGGIVGGWIKEAIKVGDWVEHTVQIFPKDMETVFDDLRLTMRFNGYKGIMYFDDFSLGNIEERPRE